MAQAQVSSTLRDRGRLLIGELGGLAVLGIFGKQWTVQECLDKFVSCSKEIFRIGLPALSPFSLYSSKRLYKALQQSFCDGSDPNYVFGFPGSGRTQCKFGVTAYSSERDATVVISNYNRATSKSESGALLKRAAHPSSEALIWEA